MSFWSQKKILQKIHFWFFVLFPFILAITSADPVLWNIKLMLPWITNCSLQEVDVTLLHRWRKCTQNKSQETRVCVSKIHAHIFNCKRTWRIHQAKTNVTAGLLQEEHWTLPPLLCTTKTTQVGYNEKSWAVQSPLCMERLCLGSRAQSRNCLLSHLNQHRGENGEFSWGEDLNILFYKNKI